MTLYVKLTCSGVFSAVSDECFVNFYFILEYQTLKAKQSILYFHQRYF